MSNSKICKICGNLFIPGKFHPYQENCDSLRCQKERRKRYLTKYGKMWRERHKNYFKEYRSKYREKNL